MTATDDSIQALLAVKASDLLGQRACYVERRLLEGCDRLIVETDIYAEGAGLVAVPVKFRANLRGTVSKTVYEIPRWRDHPRDRLRIWQARRRYRRLASHAPTRFAKATQNGGR
jgi:hypothetical protein